VLQLHQTAPVPDIRTSVPGISEPFAAAITKSLAKQPHERWATAAEMAAAMRP